MNTSSSLQASKTRRILKLLRVTLEKKLIRLLPVSGDEQTTSQLTTTAKTNASTIESQKLGKRTDQDTITGLPGKSSHLLGTRRLPIGDQCSLQVTQITLSQDTVAQSVSMFLEIF